MEISTDTIFALSSLLLSGIALWHTYSVNKSFARNQLIIDQIKSVNELLTYLNSKKIEIKFIKISDDAGSRASQSAELTLFELAGISEAFNEFDNSRVVLDSNRCNEVFDFLKFMNDPLMPAAIVNELSKFMSGRNFQLQTYGHFSGNTIVMIDKGARYDYNLMQYQNDELRDKLIMGNAIALQSWLSFKTCCNSLKKEINNWFTSKSISDLNIRTDFQPY